MKSSGCQTMKALRVRQDALPNKLLRMVIFLYNTHTNTHTLTFKPRTSSTQTRSSSLSRSDIWSLNKVACPLQLIPLQVCALFNVILAELQNSCILPVRYSGGITLPSLITPIQAQCLNSADVGRPLEWTVFYFAIPTGSIVTMELFEVLVWQPRNERLFIYNFQKFQ